MLFFPARFSFSAGLMNAIIFIFNCVEVFVGERCFCATVKDIISETKGSEIAVFVVLVQRRYIRSLCALCGAGNKKI